MLNYKQLHYFWAVARDYRIDDVAVSQLWEGAPGVLMQDVEAVEAIEQVYQRYQPDFPEELNLRADAGAVRARRIIERLIAEESTAAERGA